jgi:hypothetical protein
MSFLKSAAVVVLGAGTIFGAIDAHAQSALGLTEDGAHRSADIHWPDGFTPEDADLYAHNEIFVSAPCATVWGHIVEAPKWPAWYPNAQNVRILGSGDALKADSHFAFDTFGIHIDARIGEYVAGRRIGWFGDGSAINAYHTWLLADAPGGCQVVTEEVAKGPGAIAIRRPDPAAMHKGHDLWLTRLKALSEPQD